MTDPVREEALVVRLRAAGCVYAEEEAALILQQAALAGGAPAQVSELERLAAARESGLPLEQVLGWAELAGVRVALEPGVFVPRQRTAVMVAAAVELGRAAVARHPAPVVLLDLCCGSGAVAAGVVHGLGSGVDLEVTAADLDPVAVRCAAGNLPGARVLRSDLFADLPDDLQGRVDVLTANVPYVPSDAVALMPREAREHEPRLALDGGKDGLAVLRQVAAAAPTWLAPGGTVLLETSGRQRPAALAALEEAGLRGSARTDDELGAVVVLGARPAEAREPRR